MLRGPGHFEGKPLEKLSDQIEIGSGLYLSEGCEIHDDGPVAIGDDVICGVGVVIRSAARTLTRIGSQVWLGDRVEVRAGARIGDGAMVCAGTIVEGEIPPHAVLEGSPARVAWYLKW